ncbi:hypothetical protein PMAYCL1PPCAC_32877, partial [Pristionchus mayeri]
MVRTFGTKKCEGREGLIIMEDLSNRMASEDDFTKGFSVEVVKQILRAIAGFQSAYLSSAKKFPASDKTIIHDVVKQMAGQFIDEFPKKKSTDRRHALLSMAVDVKNMQDEYADCAKSRPLTLNHCDLWPNNMIFGKTDQCPE